MKFLYLASTLLLGTALGQGQSDLVNACNKLTNNITALEGTCEYLNSGNGNNPVVNLIQPLIQPCISKCTDDTCKQKCLTDLFTSVTGKNFNDVISCSGKCKPDDLQCSFICLGNSLPDNLQAKIEKCETDCKDDSDCFSKCSLNLVMDIFSTNFNSTNGKNNSTSSSKTSDANIQYNLASIGLTTIGFCLISLCF